MSAHAIPSGVQQAQGSWEHPRQRQPRKRAQFDTDIHRWGIGTAWLNLTEDQYEKLKR